MASRKKKGAAARPSDRSAGASRQLRAGMPAPDSVVSESTLISPKGNVYRIIKTNEVDEYEEETNGEDKTNEQEKTNEPDEYEEPPRPKAGRRPPRR